MLECTNALLQTRKSLGVGKSYVCQWLGIHEGTGVRGFGEHLLETPGKLCGAVRNHAARRRLIEESQLEFPDDDLVIRTQKRLFHRMSVHFNAIRADAVC